jgi:ADP-ribose pyrophosphatase YjhB (NUDIX family)
MKFCSSCGETIVIRIPDGDNRERHVCISCETIHYYNPRIITGCLPIYEDKVLLCKRAIEPRRNYWTLPAGFMENGETTDQGAIRESYEEAKAELGELSLYCLYSVPEINQVFFFYRAQLKHATAFGVGEESTEVRLFSENEIPWENLAFYTVVKTLRYYFSDRKNGVYPIREENLIRPEKYRDSHVKKIDNYLKR